MYFITNVLRLFSLILLFTLSACGGGGGGGDSGPSLSLSTNTLTFTASNLGAAPAPQTVTATINGSVSGTLYIRVVSTGLAVTAISDVTITGPRTGEATVHPASPGSLGRGAHQGTITVTACTTDPSCSSGVIGTTQTINVTYNVTWPSGSVGSSCSGSTSSSGASGSLGTGFCNTGHLVFDSIFRAYSSEEGRAIKVDSGGNILIGGYTTNADGNFDTALWRYSSTGAVDTGFGTDFDSDGIMEGFATYDGATGSFRTDEIYAITTDGSGRILVAGSTENGVESDIFVFRYNSDGSLDTNFANGGRFIHNGAAGGNGIDNARGIVVDGSGNIVVAGSSVNAAGNFDMVVWRLLDNGSLDTTFGGDYDGNSTKDGFVIHNNAAGGNANDFGNALLMDGSGRILVAGSSSAGFSGPNEVTDMVVWRFTSAGVLDTTFGVDYDSSSTADGFLRHNGATGTASYDAATALALDSNQRIVVVGSSFSTGTNYKLVAWRLTSNGVMDTSFGANYDNSGGPDGYVKWGSNNGSWDSAQAVAVDASNRIVVAGGRSNDLVVLRYTSAGALDNTFGTNGATYFTNATARGLTLKPTGEILVTGSYYNGNNYDMAIWQYVP